MPPTPDDWRCEMSVGCDSTMGSAPLVLLCGKPAKLRGIAAMCDECFELWKKSRECPQ